MKFELKVTVQCGLWKQTNKQTKNKQTNKQKRKKLRPLIFLTRLRGTLSYRPIPGKVKLLLISGKKSPSLLDHISRFLSHQFVTWYLRCISKTKIVKLFCPCMSEHMIYIKNVTNVTQMLHQNVTNVTKQNIASKEILTIEFYTKYMKLFVNMLSVIENIYFEVIWSRTIVSCKVTNMTNRYMDFNLDLDEEFNFQRPVYVLTWTGSTIINQKLVDSMFAPGAVAI